MESFGLTSRKGAEVIIDQIYRRSQAAVSPVVGTGLKIKIVDALAKGKPVFASQSSLAGLPPGYEGCVFPIQRRIMSRILDHEEYRRAAVRESRAYFASIGQRGDHEELLTLLRRLSDPPRTRPRRRPRELAVT
jgi:hypothetical protein